MSAKIIAITACPNGIAHTYMAAEKLEQAAARGGIDLKVETQGSIGVENEFTAADIAQADAVLIAADKAVDMSRFAGKRVLKTGVAEGIHDPEGLLDRVLEAPVLAGSTTSEAPAAARGTVYTALMNGVSYMVPFVVVGGLFIALALSLGGQPTAEGLKVPEGSYWNTVLQVGAVGFQLMVPVLSGYIAYALADRPGLVPGMITGWIANTGTFYDSESGAGFIGAIVTGFLSGYLALAIKKVRVPKMVAPIMPIIVIPVVTTAVVGFGFILLLGRPLASVFGAMTDFLGGLQGGNVVLLGIVLGAMIAFDMGGPVNKTAFLFGTALIASGNNQVMGMVAAAIAIPPIGMGIATLLRRNLFTEQERDAGYAAIFLGSFGITEGAIPFAAARPLQVIPANIAGGALGGAIAGVAGVGNAVPHGGFIVAVLGVVSNVGWYVAAIVAGSLTTALTAIALIGWKERRGDTGAEGSSGSSRTDRPAMGGMEDPHQEVARTGHRLAVSELAGAGAALLTGDVTAASSGLLAEIETESDTAAASRLNREGESRDGEIFRYLDESTVSLGLRSTTKREAIEELVTQLERTGAVVDREAVLRAAYDREAQMTTGIGDSIAIPHAKTDGVSRPVVAFSRSRDGVEWESLDGSPARILFLIAVPESSAGSDHLAILAMLSRKLVDPSFRERLERAGDKEEVMDLLGEVGK